MLGSRNSGTPMVSPSQRERNAPYGGLQRSQMNDTLETLKGALIGFTATRVRTLLDQILPGFSEQYEKMDRGRIAAK